MKAAVFDTPRDKVLLFFIYILLTIIGIITFYPFWDLFVLSLSPYEESFRIGIRLFPANPTLASYVRVLSNPEIGMGYYNTILRTVLGTATGVLITFLTAYPLSKKNLPFNGVITLLFVFTMIFNAGLIPNYLNIKSLGLLNSFWVLVLPGAVSPYNIIIARNFFQGIPESLSESAKIDGASEMKIWYRIVLPLSKPVIATIALWVAVAHWNSYFDVLIYITDRSRMVLQVILRRIVLENQTQEMLLEVPGINDKPTPEIIKATVIMVATIPILCVYPFVQKYFVKGVMIGSVKG